MTFQIADNKKILKNTLALYCRMFLTMIIGLFTSRMVLKFLGVVDYGIYNVVGGVVVMFSFLNGTMAAATQRFLSFALGENNVKKVNEVFNVALVLHIIICVIVLLIGETIGLWFLNNKMDIPASRMGAANLVYQLSLFAAIFNITQVPYTAVITAREKMSVYAYISIVDALLKMALVGALFVIPFDKLKVYSVLILISGLVILLITRIYCIKNFDEVKLHFVREKNKYAEIVGYVGWNLSSHLVLSARTQGVNVLINIFLGPVFNAARGISVQVNDIILRFVRNFQTAAIPQITKLYACGQLEEMKKLIIMSSKISFMLLAFLMLPIILETETVLSLWLGDIPEWTVDFCRMTLIASLADVLSGTLVYGALAVGTVKKYHFTLDVILSLNFMLSFFFLKNGFNPLYIYYIEIAVYLVCLIARLLFLKSYIGLSLRTYMKDVVARNLIVVASVLAITLEIRFYMDSSISRLILICFSSSVTCTISIVFLGMNRIERNIFFKKLSCKAPFLARFVK